MLSNSCSKIHFFEWKFTQLVPRTFSILPTMSLSWICYHCYGVEDGRGWMITGQVTLSSWLFRAPSIVDALWWGLIRNTKYHIPCAHFTNAIDVTLPCTTLPLTFRCFSFQALSSQPCHLSKHVSLNSLTLGNFTFYTKGWLSIPPKALLIEKMSLTAVFSGTS